jgi:DNA replication and checkpoint protein
VRPTRNKPSQATIEGKPTEEDDKSDLGDDGVEVDEPFEPTGAEKAPTTTKDSATGAKKTTKKAPDRGNYRKLKIKNKNSKARGRFGRRR